MSLPTALTDAEARAAVGPRADYYLDAWSRPERLFNWAGFFTSMLWVSYRKMYRHTAILGSVIIVESVAEEVVFVSWLGAPSTPRWVEALAGLVVACVCARFGNDWYRAHVARVVASARAVEPDEQARLFLLGRKGGTSVWTAVAAVVAFLFAMLAAFSLLEVVGWLAAGAEGSSAGGRRAVIARTVMSYPTGQSGTVPA